MAIENFQQLADYNRWANLRLYGAALDLPEQQYRRAIGVFFGSLHGTLNHLLVTDRIWMKRLTGQGQAPNRLDAILHDNRQDLLRARIAEDARLTDLVRSYTEADLTRAVAYQTMAGKPYTQPLPGTSAASVQSSDPPPRPGPRLLFPSSPAPNRRRSTCWRSARHAGTGSGFVTEVQRAVVRSRIS